MASGVLTHRRILTDHDLVDRRRARRGGAVEQSPPCPVAAGVEVTGPVNPSTGDVPNVSGGAVETDSIEHVSVVWMRCDRECALPAPATTSRHVRHSYARERRGRSSALPRCENPSGRRIQPPELRTRRASWRHGVSPPSSPRAGPRPATHTEEGSTFTTASTLPKGGWCGGTRVTEILVAPGRRRWSWPRSSGRAPATSCRRSRDPSDGRARSPIPPDRTPATCR